MKVLIGGYALSLVGGVVCFFADRPLAVVVSTGGVVLTQLAVLAWIGLRDPMNAWPGVGAWERIGRVLTFSRRSDA
jgi:hypothetical protein